MKIYKKWFVVDIDDKENENALHSFVREYNYKTSFFEINGIRYKVVGKSKWMFDGAEKDRSFLYEKNLRKKLKSINDKCAILEIEEIKEKIKDCHYWKYQVIYVKKEIQTALKKPKSGQACFKSK